MGAHVYRIGGVMISTITGGETEIVRPYIDSIADPNYKKYNGYHTGVDLKATSVYNLCPGTAVFVGEDATGQIVIVQHDISHCVMYKELKSVAVSAGQFVDSAQLIGTVKSYVHVDYLTDGNTMWPVRVGSQTLYKHDPTDIIFNGYESFVNYADAITSSTDIYVYDDELPPSVDHMLSNNRGE